MVNADAHPPGGVPELLAVRLAVPDVAAASRLYGEVLGGQPVDGFHQQRGFAWPGGLVLLEATSGPFGPCELIISTDDPGATAAFLRDEGVGVTSSGDEAVVTDEELGGGQVRIVPRDHPVAAAAGRPAAAGTSTGAAGVRSLDHVCLAIPDVARGARVLGSALAGRIVLGGDSPWGARALQIRYRTGKLELLAPLDPAGPVGSFLGRRGGRAGIHHLTMLVDDVERAASACVQAGFGTVDTDTSASTWHETFVRPRTAFGFLIQLAWTDQRYDDALPRSVLEDVLAGRYVATAHVMRRQGAST